MDPAMAKDYKNIKNSIKDPKFLRRLQEYSPSSHALTRDTCSLTRMKGSTKINVVPPEAWAEVDCRMLPDRTTEEFISDFKNYKQKRQQPTNKPNNQTFFSLPNNNNNNSNGINKKQIRKN